jgi:hypothetical protein
MSNEKLNQLPACNERTGSTILQDEKMIPAMMCQRRNEVNLKICQSCNGIKFPTIEIIREIISN